MGLKTGFGHGGGGFTSAHLPPPKWRNRTVEVINPPSDLLAVEFSETQIDLTWIDHSDNEDGFKIERKVDAGNYSVIHTTIADVQAWSDMSVSAGHTFTYRVRAYKAPSSYSTYSNTSAVTISGGTTLLTPYNLTTMRYDSRSGQVDWSDDDPDTLIDGFKIERKSNAGPYSQIDTVPYSNNSMVPGLGLRFYYWDAAIPADGTTYTYQVRAYKTMIPQDDNSNYSNEGIITDTITPLALYPNTPYLSITASDDTSITLGWNDVNGVTIPPQYYNEDGTKIERNHAGAGWVLHDTVGSDVVTYIDKTDLVYGDIYAYRVKAFYHTYPGVPSTFTTDTNDSEPSNEVSTTLGNYVSPPLNLSVNIGTPHSGSPEIVALDLSWTYPIDQSTPTIMGFELERCTDAVHYDWITTVGPTDNYYPNKTYGFTTKNFIRGVTNSDVEMAMDDTSWLFANDAIVVGNDKYTVKSKNETVTTDNFIQPAQGSTVTIPVVDTSWMIAPSPITTTTADFIVPSTSYPNTVTVSVISTSSMYYGQTFNVGTGGVYSVNYVASGVSVVLQHMSGGSAPASITTTTADFVQPDVSGTVTVAMADTSAIVTGNTVTITYDFNYSTYTAVYTVGTVHSGISVDLVYVGGGFVPAVQATTQASFIQPALNGTVTGVIVDSDSWMMSHNSDYIVINGSTYSVAPIGTWGDPIDLTWLGGGVAEGVTIDFPASVYNTVPVVSGRTVKKVSVVASGASVYTPTNIKVNDGVYTLGTVHSGISVDLTYVSGGTAEGNTIYSGTTVSNESVILTFTGALTTKTAASFVQPEQYASVTVAVDDTSWLATDDSVTINDSVYTVGIINSLTSVDLAWQSGGVAEGQTIPLALIFKTGSLSSSTTTTADFILPAVSSTITAAVQNTSWMSPTNVVSIGDRLFTVGTINTGTSVDLTYNSGTAPTAVATTTADFDQPAQYASVTVATTNTSLLPAVGSKVNIGLSIYRVGTIVVNTSVVLQWLGGGPGQGTTISSGAELYNGVIGTTSEIYKAITIGSGATVYNTNGRLTVIDGVYYYYRARAVRYLPV